MQLNILLLPNSSALFHIFSPFHGLYLSRKFVEIGKGGGNDKREITHLVVYTLYLKLSPLMDTTIYITAIW